jgi:hypothetical protein
MQLGLNVRPARGRMLEVVDPLAEFFTARLGLGFVGMSIVASALQLVSLVVFPVVLLLRTNGDTVSRVLHNVPQRDQVLMVSTLVYSFLITPTIWGSYVWIRSASDALLRRLVASVVLEANLTVVGVPRSEVRRSLPRFGARWVIASVTVVSVVALAFLVGPFIHYRDEGTWPFVYTMMPLWLIGWYIVCQICVHQLAVVHGLRTLFRGRTIRVNPFHKDRCGGFRVLQDYTVRFLLLLGVMGGGIAIIGVTNSLIGAEVLTGRDVWTVVLVALYAVGVLVGIAPVWITHCAMRSSKAQRVAAIGAPLSDGYCSLSFGHLVDGEEPKRCEARLNRVATLYDVWRLTSEVPTWPVNVGAVARLVGVIGTPLWVVFLGVLSNLIAGGVAR